ncbi:hypothetical protein [Actinoplanes sp. NPDC048796]|uniref:hypothetical protein n=1 Tax=unclassified Actinoplanes TaxID=2626549 RepID=UPI0033D0CA74
MPFLPFLTAMLVGALPAPVTPRTAPTFNGGVYAIAHRGDTVYVGGAFTSASAGGKTYKRMRLAAFDARTGDLLDWAPPADGTVRALATTADSVYAAGDFHEVGGEDRDSLARINPSSGAVASFAHEITGTAYALGTAGNRLYLGGSFTAVDDERRGNLAAFDLTTGRLDTRWRPLTDDTVHALTVAGPRVYLGGGFHIVNGVKGTLRLAAVSSTSGAVDPVFRPRVPAEVRAIAVDVSGVQVATAGVGGRALSYATTGALRWQRVFDGDAAAIASAGGITYVGGHFDAICRTERNGAKGGCVDGATPRLKLAALTANGTLTSWGPKANGVIGVRVLTVHKGTVQAGGDFTTIDGRDRRRFAAF